MNSDAIEILGAREHNLKGGRVLIPKLRLVLFSGVSGSGKSSLAFDTLFAEGQRRYVESLSAYARQFLGQLDKPRYDAIHGLTPTIAIEQKSASSNPRSTVGTITEIHDYLRVLFARAGDQFCHSCGRPVARQEPVQIVREILAFGREIAPSGKARVVLLAPLVSGRKGEYRDLFESLRADGFARVRVDGDVLDLAEVTSLDRKRKHDIDVVVDRIVLKDGIEARLTDSVETALKAGNGRLILSSPGRADRTFSEHLACEVCNLSFPEPSPQLFSFNNPVGACPECNGLGTAQVIDPDKLVPDPSLSLRQGAVEPWSRVFENGGLTQEIVRGLSQAHGIDLDAPFGSLPREHVEIIFFGAGKRVPIDWNSRNFKGSVNIRYEGIANTLLRRYRETRSPEMRTYYQKFMTDRPCSTCGGRRLRPEALAVKVGGFGIAEMSDMTITSLHDLLAGMSFDESKAVITAELLKEIKGRLQLLVNLGIGYLTLSRAGATLSGGEAQRIRLASQLGSELTGVTYVLDEPSIGLHPRDNGRLIETLKHLRDLGNTVVVVEHDRDAIMSADHVIEFGPGAGRRGGNVVFEGTPAGMLKSSESLTGAYFSGRKTIPVPQKRRKSRKKLTLMGASGHNLKDLDARFPIGTFVVVTGVSGAGKSSLVTSTLSPALTRELNGGRARPLPYREIRGISHLDKVIVVNQEPIGRTPRSNPATYTKVFDHVRKLFANTKEARIYGFRPGRFSFNVRGGRCERCQGAGVIRVEMHFLADVFVTCEECRGRRFNEATLRVRFKDLTIADVLGLTVDEAWEVFENQRPIRRILSTLRDVGLGYITLGQPSPTLSGGEAQRIKLARELARASTGRTLYIMDEPSTGLHVDDVRHLLSVVDRLVSKGNTVIMIEHNLEILKTADHIIDLGPEGGDDGGSIVAVGTPEEVAARDDSYTGQALRTVLDARKSDRSTRAGTLT
ncbi:MAG: excinuclease ABC subunit UvrA [Deltaproteobacteria bacterium]|nr:excinuclease ABC subunit UvrA [Deltaproteobacteria bacterium]